MRAYRRLSIEEQIREAVADAIETGSIVDVQETADAIAGLLGCPRFSWSIAADLAEAAAAARVPMKLVASVRSWRDLLPSRVAASA
jgi:hypothetical protein